MWFLFEPASFTAIQLWVGMLPFFVCDCSEISPKVEIRPPCTIYMQVSMHKTELTPQVNNGLAPREVCSG